MDRKDFPEWCDDKTVEEILKAAEEIDLQRTGADTLMSGSDKNEK
ncbi:MAG: hypothetical protein AABZ57_05710 [Candidatus Margulisiibacteriota bacterium]